MIGLWVIEQWQKIGSPQKFTLLELGPGQGLLMRDLLKVLDLTPGIKEAISLKMYDVNPYFITKQQQILKDSTLNIEWLDNLDNLPKQPIIVISNEFFDALPIKQYKKIKKHWYESIMVIDPIDGRIKFDKIIVHNNLQKQWQQDHPNAQDGAIIEESTTAFDIVKKLAKLIKKYKGSCLTIDYGYNIKMDSRLATQYNSTLQAIKDHTYQPIIDTLGEADLSAHVDFQNLKKVVLRTDITKTSICTQGQFLKKYGILLRLKTLQATAMANISTIDTTGAMSDTRSATSDNVEILSRQVHRLTAKEQMGDLFKVLQFWQY